MPCENIDGFYKSWGDVFACVCAGFVMLDEWENWNSRGDDM